MPNHSSINEATHWVLAYYHINPIVDPHAEVAKHKEFFADKDVACRIYISEEGINGQMSATKDAGKAYIAWMQARPEFSDLRFKIHTSDEHVFPRKTVKYRKKLVAIDTEVDFSLRGEHVSPSRWREMLENETEHLLLDVRNDYEWKIGRFAGAELPPCETFRDFAAYADNLKETKNPESTPVMMYCTGGIRCELYSAILKQRGFNRVYQLDGGVIDYGIKEGSEHWLGRLFVFDDRLAVPISNDKTPEVISTCHHCGKPNDNYYNCANMDCNNLFLCCPDCLNKLSGCCCTECTNASRLRPYHHQDPHKPFRKWYHYENELPPETMQHKKGVKK